MLVFSTQLCGLLPSNLLSGATPPLLCVNKYRYCLPGGGLWGSGPQTDKHLPQSPFTDKFYMLTICIAFDESYFSTFNMLRFFVMPYVHVYELLYFLFLFHCDIMPECAVLQGENNGHLLRHCLVFGIVVHLLLGSSLKHGISAHLKDEISANSWKEFYCPPHEWNKWPPHGLN
jgi:hypothetical protein